MRATTKRRATFSIPLSERAYQHVMREAARAGKMPTDWLEQDIMRRTRDHHVSTEVSAMIHDFMQG